MQDAGPPAAPPDTDAPRRRLLDPLRRVARLREGIPMHATFDPVRVETELYDAIYGRRTGTVDNVAPVARESDAGAPL